jgi:hypothetical protein
VTAGRVLSDQQKRALAQIRDNIAGSPEAAGPASLGRPVADGLRAEYPELPDATLAHLTGNLAAYARQFCEDNPGVLAVHLAVVLAAAATDLAALDVDEGDAR